MGAGEAPRGLPRAPWAASPDAPRCAGDARSLREGFAQREGARGAGAQAPKTADAALSLHPAMSRHQRCIHGQTAGDGRRSTFDLLKGVSVLNTPPRPTLPATASVSPDSCFMLSELWPPLGSPLSAWLWLPQALWTNRFYFPLQVGNAPTPADASLVCMVPAPGEDLTPSTSQDPWDSGRIRAGPLTAATYKWGNRVAQGPTSSPEITHPLAGQRLEPDFRLLCP